MNDFVSVPRDLWGEIVEFIEDQVDVRDGEDGSQLPNEAMHLSTRIEREVSAAPSVKKLGFAAAVREYGDDWVHNGFAWNGTSYRGMSPATIMAMQDSRGPDDEDMYRMRDCERHGRIYQVSEFGL